MPVLRGVPRSGGPAAKRRVLLVDEDPLVRLAVDRQLEALGWEAVPVNSGAEAIRVVELGLNIEVLLTDLLLPDLDGVTIAWAVTRLSRRTRIIFMAAHAPVEPLEPRGAPLLLKPFSTPALGRALEAAVLMVPGGR